MRFYVEDDILTIQHPDEVNLDWDFSLYRQRNGPQGPPPDIFTYLNRYISTLPPETQDRMYAIYARIHMLISLPDSSPEDIQKGLTIQLGDLFHECINFNNAHEFICSADDIKLSEDIKSKVTDSEGYMTGSESRTYVTEDYYQLLTLCMLVRLVMPAWAFYIRYIQQTLNNTIWQFSQALKIIDQTGIKELPCYKRLRDYIDETVVSQKTDIALTTVYSGVAKVDFPEWVMSKVVTRKLGVIDISGETGHAVASIYTITVSAVKRPITDKSNIYEKKFDTNDKDNKVARAEEWITREELNTVHRRLIVMECEDLTKLIQRLLPNPNLELMQVFIDASLKAKNRYLSPVQITLTQWVLGRVVHPNVFLHLDQGEGRDQALSLIGLAGYYCFEVGFKHIGAIILAYIPQQIQVKINPNMRTKLTNTDIEKLSVHYRSTKEILECLNSVDKAILASPWRSMLPTELTSDFGITKDQNLEVPVDIKVQLANLIVHLNEAGFNQ